MLECCEGDVTRAVELYFAREAVVETVRSGTASADVEVIEEDEVLVDDEPAGVAEDGVRAPMRKVRERIVEGSYREQYGEARVRDDSRFRLTAPESRASNLRAEPRRGR